MSGEKRTSHENFGGANKPESKEMKEEMDIENLISCPIFNYPPSYEYGAEAKVMAKLTARVKSLQALKGCLKPATRGGTFLQASVRGNVFSAGANGKLREMEKAGAMWNNFQVDAPGYHRAYTKVQAIFPIEFTEAITRIDQLIALAETQKKEIWEKLRLAKEEEEKASRESMKRIGKEIAERNRLALEKLHQELPGHTFEINGMGNVLVDGNYTHIQHNGVWSIVGGLGGPSPIERAILKVLGGW